MDPAIGDTSYHIKQRRKLRPTLVEAGEERYCRLFVMLMLLLSKTETNL